MTLKQIADALGVSTVTVSKALNDKPDISEGTKRRIMKYAEEMGYSANSVARSLRTKKSQIIGAIVTNISNPFYAALLAEIEERLFEAGYSLIIVTTQMSSKRENDAVKMLVGKQVDGILVVPVAEYEGQQELFERLQTPYVVIGREIKDVDASSVVIDDIQCGYLGTRKLIESGCKKILFVNGAAGTISCDRRLRGYEKALKEAGIRKCGELIQHVGEFTPNAVYDRMIQLINSGDVSFDGVITYNDNYAFHVLHALGDMGIKVPEEVSVISIDGAALCEACTPQLSSVSLPIQEIGMQACEIILEKINRKALSSEEGGSDVIIHKMVQPYIVDRKTIKMRGVSYEAEK